MALTPEQQAQLDFQTAIDAARFANQKEAEIPRMRLEALRMAKDVLTENARSKPADSRDITAEDITSFADTLMAYTNA